jgi:hypothetical protein
MEEERPGGRGLALLLAAAAVVAAVVGARASLLGSSASGNWQQAVRQEVKAAAAIVEDIRFVYGPEAGQAFRAVEAAVRAEEYRAAAEQQVGLARAVLLAEASAQDQLRDILIGVSEVAKDPKYARDDGGFDLGLRLRDMRDRYPDLVALRPDDPQSAGDRLARQAVGEAAVTIPVALTFLFGALAQGFRRRRRIFLALGAVALAGGIVAAGFVELTA